MKFILKILLAPVMLILAFLIWLCTLTLHISSVLLNILSVLLVLPMLGAWLVAQLHLLRDWMKEKVYW